MITKNIMNGEWQTDNFRSQLVKLSMMIGSGGLTGGIAIAALAGIFKIENAPSIAVSFLAGPGSILTAALLEGSVRERIITALLAGIISTVIVILAAGFGPNMLSFVNIDILKIFGGLSVLAISLLIMGIGIPEKIPVLIMIAGFAISLIWK